MKIDKAKQKRFRLLCRDKQFRSDFWWFQFKIVSNTYGIDYKVPKFIGDRMSATAYREYLANLIQVYAPRRICQVGHRTRYDECHICAMENEARVMKEFEAIRDRMLAKKRISLDDWLLKIRGKVVA